MAAPLEAPAPAGWVTTLFAIVALLAVLLFTGLALMQWLELQDYRRPPSAFPATTIGAIPRIPAPVRASEAPAEVKAEPAEDQAGPESAEEAETPAEAE